MDVLDGQMQGWRVQAAEGGCGGVWGQLTRQPPDPQGALQLISGGGGAQTCPGATGRAQKSSA